MKNLTLRTLFLATLTLPAALAVPIVTPIAPPAPRYVGDTLTVAIQISNADFINGYQFDLAFTPGNLMLLSVEEGGFLPLPLFASPLYDDSDIANGNLLAIGNYMADAGVSGSGILVKLKFKALAVGPVSISATGGLYTSLDDWDNGTQVDIIASTIETVTFNINQRPVGTVPEPSTLALVGVALAGIAWRRSRS